MFSISAITSFSRMTVARACDAVNVRDSGSASPESKDISQGQLLPSLTSNLNRRGSMMILNNFHMADVVYFASIRLIKQIAPLPKPRQTSC